MLKPSPRTNPHSVMPAACAEIDRQARRRRHRRHQRHAAEQRLLHQLEATCARSPPASSDRAAAGLRAARAPMILSTALWRPTSSAARSTCPLEVGERGGVDAAGGVEGPLRRAQRQRQLADDGRRHRPAAGDRGRRGSAATRWCGVRTVRRPRWSITCRRSPSRTASRSTASPATVTLSTLPRASGSTSRQYSIAPISAPSRTTSSASRKPAARARSSPGVRMITAKGEPLTRTSIGSSTATASRSDRVAVPRRRSTATTRTPRPASAGGGGDPRSPLTSGPTRSSGARRPGRPAARVR